MAANTIKQNAQCLYDAAWQLRKEWENDFAGIVRSKVFVSYKEANSYYRNEPVRLMKSAMALATKEKNENLEVECAYSLFRFLSYDMKDDDKKTFLATCLNPLLDFLISHEAKGNLHYYLGTICEKLRLSEWMTENYRAAIELDNERVLKDDNVFWSNPDFIFVWLRKYMGDKDCRERTDSYEHRYNEVTALSGKRPQYALQLAKLHKDKKTGHEDKYFRECIRLGVPEVVNRSEFLKIEYEEDFIKWYEKTIEEGGDPLKGQKDCLEKLWKTGTVSSFSESHRVFAETLIKKCKYREAFEEYNRCAVDGLPWAKEFLLERIVEEEVQDAISDELIERWFKEKEIDEKTINALGLLLQKRRPDLAKTRKGKLCISKRKVSEPGGLLPALGFFREAEAESKEAVTKDKELMEYVLAAIDEDVEREYQTILIKQFSEEKITFDIRDKVLSLIVKSLSSSSSISDWEVLPSFHRFLESRLDDGGGLRRFYEDGRLEVNMFRQADEVPLYSRYLLLKQLSSLALTAYYNASEATNANFQAQQKHLNAQAQQELEALLDNYDFHALLATVVEYLNVSISRAKGIACLYALAALAVKPQESPLPFLLLANHWSHGSGKENLVQLLRHLLKRRDDFEDFCAIKEVSSLKRTIFEFFEA